MICQFKFLSLLLTIEEMNVFNLMFIYNYLSEYRPIRAIFRQIQIMYITKTPKLA